jgi:fructose-1,6-bisphosphatase I
MTARLDFSDPTFNYYQFSFQSCSRHSGWVDAPRPEAAADGEASKDGKETIMAIGMRLDARLLQDAASELDRGLASIVTGIAEAAIGIGEIVALGCLAGDLAGRCGCVNADGDAQRVLDVLANDRLMDALRKSPVAAAVSEELEDVVVLDPEAPLAVAIDPLDGSSNIGANISIGTIFSIVPAHPHGATRPVETFLQAGSAQLAAGFVVYGPQTALVLSLGRGVQIFILDRAVGAFRLALDEVSVPRTANEFAINASNQRHWEDPIRTYVNDCLQGAEGPRGKDFNMRWIASLVAEAYRILTRGGVFLYPGDRRKGFQNGRLRLIYEANAVAFLIEQAGGAATDCVGRILDIRPTSLHQRTRFIFGSAEKVARIARYHSEPNGSPELSPLFGRRGLLRA